MKYNFSVEVETTADFDGFYAQAESRRAVIDLARHIEHSLRVHLHVPDVAYPLRAIDVRPVTPAAAGAAVVQ